MDAGPLTSDASEPHSSGTRSSPPEAAVDPSQTSELIRLLASTESIDGFLNDLVAHAGQVTEHSCSITARTSADPHYYTVASTDDRTRQLDEQQYADQGGPCLEALQTGLPVGVPDTPPSWGPPRRCRIR
jgi:hypothetical protein